MASRGRFIAIVEPSKCFGIRARSGKQTALNAKQGRGLMLGRDRPLWTSEVAARLWRVAFGETTALRYA
jgi:hypothetical protein